MIFFLLPIAALIAAAAGVVVFAGAYVFIRRPPAGANRFGSPSPTQTVAGALGRAAVRIFDVRGRANRKDFWTIAVSEALVAMALFLGLPVLLMMNIAVDYSVVTLWIGLGLLLLAGVLGGICSMSLAIRRLHDVNRSGWWILLLGVFGYFILLYWFLQPSVRAADEDAQLFT